MTLQALPGRERSDALDGDVVAHYITRADDAHLPRFYAAYDAAFILPDEKEDLDGFCACLALNDGEAYERLSALYGPYREMVILLTEGANGPVLGAANFIAFAGNGADPTVSLSYIFVDASQRRRGLFGLLMHLVREEARDAFSWPEGPAPAPLIFIEMNNPVKMNPEDYALDSDHAGLDQVDRLKIWERRGARLVGMEYRQPPLSDSQGSEDELLLGVIGSGGASSLPACRLAAHMRRFFGVTVLKGRAPESAPVAASQLARLDAACAAGESIPLTGFDAVYDAARQVLQDRS
ncbi:hypothetical protein K1X12_06805 [Hyphomonas sp. WL0036]|uniref:hypothetical protein n=1 Tax=Hyphomonas sediminis TaxID=2866160 RepID=UPI001C7E827B|nr:hypothetical protein [Hyphomonas sediminis]MBY9066602.1 hypothetical protein [Hyphomonas sediminis]